MEKRDFAFESMPNSFEGEFFEKMKRRELEKKEILSNHNYILWLEKFTLQYDSFSDHAWTYNPEEISDADRHNVDKLEFFFDILSEYCHKYYIDIACKDTYVVESINIKHNGIGYQFGLVVGQGGYVYVKRGTPEDGAIKFDDVLNDIMPEDFEPKKALLSEFKRIVTELKANNIPTSVLLGIVSK